MSPIARNARRAGSRGRVAFSLAMAGALLAPLAGAQEASPEKPETAPPPTVFDLSWKVRNPKELHPEKVFQNNWRRIWRSLGMRAHLYPAQVTGRENWPPHLYAGGMNYSLWRNPVTGWLEH